jgi:ABC-type dipeptide/oligopeptide/nickel transport system permease component
VAAWLVRRLLAAVAILWAVATLAFAAIHVAPGDPFLPAADRPVDPAAAASLRRQFGLDHPLPVQYVRYLSAVASGDLGVSFSQRRSVAGTIADALPHTVLLAAAALLLDYLIGMAIGLLQAATAGRRLDDALTVLTLTVASLPAFWVALVLLLVFGEWLHWLPVAGAYDPAVYDALPIAGRVADRLRHLALPAITLGLLGAAATARYQRAALLEALGHEYVRTARAKGLSERRVLLAYAWRNALVPMTALVGLALPFLLTGAVLVETVFAWPGMGRLAADAITLRDYPLVTGTAVVASAVVVSGSLVSDILLHAVDPRVRRSR